MTPPELSSAPRRPSFPHLDLKHSRPGSPGGPEAARARVLSTPQNFRPAASPDPAGRPQTPLAQREASQLWPETHATGDTVAGSTDGGETGAPAGSTTPPAAPPAASSPSNFPPKRGKNAWPPLSLQLRIGALPVRTQKERDALYAVLLSIDVPQDEAHVQQVARMVARKVGPETMVKEFGRLVQDLHNGGRMDASSHKLLLDGMLAVPQDGGIRSKGELNPGPQGGDTRRTAELFAGLAAGGGPAGTACAERLGRWLGTREGREGSGKPGGTCARELLKDSAARSAFEVGFGDGASGAPPAAAARRTDPARQTGEEEILAEADTDDTASETEEGGMPITDDDTDREDSDFSTDTTDTDTAGTDESSAATAGKKQPAEGDKTKPAPARPLARPQLSPGVRDLLDVILRQEDLTDEHFGDAFNRMLAPDPAPRSFSLASWRSRQLSAVHVDTHRRGHERRFLEGFGHGRDAAPHRAESMRHVLLELADKSQVDRREVAALFIDHVREAYVEGRIDEPTLLAATAAAAQLVADDAFNMPDVDDQRRIIQRSSAGLVSLVSLVSDEHDSPRDDKVNRALLHAIGSAVRHHEPWLQKHLTDGVVAALPGGTVPHEHTSAARAFYDGLAQFSLH